MPILMLHLSLLLVSSVAVAQKSKVPRPPIEGVWQLIRDRGDAVDADELVVRISYPRGPVKRMVWIRELTRGGETVRSRTIYQFGTRHQQLYPSEGSGTTESRLEWVDDALVLRQLRIHMRKMDTTRTETAIRWSLEDKRTLMVVNRVRRGVGTKTTTHYFARIGAVEKGKKGKKAKKAKETS